MRLAKGRIPPSDGDDKWHFPQGKLVLRASGRDELTALIFQYRLNNNIEIGDIEREIDDFYCGKWPSFCHAEASDVDATVPRQSEEPMLNRVSRWVSATVHKMPRGGYPLVTAVEAKARADICIACKKNTPWKGGCTGCSASTLQLLQHIKQHRKTDRDGNLNACAIGTWENGAAIHLPVEALSLTDQQKASLPQACWRKK